jgi:Protein of unknown function (DUF3638)
VLVASIQNVKLFTLPFNRDVEYSADSALILGDEIDRCKSMNGCWIVTPQQRLSLLLKQYEKSIFVKELQDDLFLDILDESDALLSHDFQLVYALGTQVDLPNGPSRWKVLQAFLYILCRRDFADILDDEEMVYKEKICCGSFSNLRFLLAFQGQEMRLGRALCERLLWEPPYDLRWMKNVNGSDKECLIEMMSNPTCNNVAELIGRIPLFQQNRSDILAARGLIAFGTLFHGLGARYRVDYGLLPDPGTKLAVSNVHFTALPFHI